MREKRNDKIFQLKISLNGIRPLIWRRILIPSTATFWDLHIAIQNVFGWFDCHLHQFLIRGKLRSDQWQYIHLSWQDDWGGDDSFLDERKIKLNEWFGKKIKSLVYEYVFGDSWEHTITLEKQLPHEQVKYPMLVAGKRACPPEDCGSIPGYEHFCEVMKKKSSDEYKELSEWYGGDYDPEKFDPEEVEFEDPRKYYAEYKRTHEI
jgi:hypothetical protein